MEAKTAQEIASAEVDGKKLYTNSEQRDNATMLKLRDNKVYLKLKGDLNMIIKEKQEYENSLEILKYRFKTIQALIEIEKLET